MELEIIRNYLPTDESLNLSELRIKNRKIQNKNLDIMAESIIEKFNQNPEKSNYIKKLITLTADEFSIPDIKIQYF